MKSRFWLAMILGLVLSFAVTSAALAENAPRRDRASTTSTEYWDRTAGPNLNIGLGMAMVEGNTGWSINFGGMQRVSEEYPLFVGADLALNFWSFDSPLVNVDAGATGIQLLPSVVYGLSVAGLRGIYPYLGLSVGPNVYISKVGGASDTRILLEALVRPGVNFRLSPGIGLAVEPKFGLLSDDFIFLPSANLVVAI